MALDKNLQAIRILMRSVNFMYIKFPLIFCVLSFKIYFFLIPHFYEIIKFLNIERESNCK